MRLMEQRWWEHLPSVFLRCRLQINREMTSKTEAENDAVNNSQKDRKRAATRRRYDPIQALWSQSRTFHTAWLRNGESLNTLQRTGYTVFSLLFVAMGLYLSRFAVMFLRQGDFMIVIFGPVSLGFLVFGVLGLRNILRFGQDEGEK